MVDKQIWNERDFDSIDWHDHTLWSIAFFDQTYEFAMDIDYILKWVAPENGEDQLYRFWVAPATLVFRNVYDLSIDLEPFAKLYIESMERSEPGVPKNAEYIGVTQDWCWEVELSGGTISLRSTGFDLYVRRPPELSYHRFLSLEDRGGISFNRSLDPLRPATPDGSRTGDSV